MSERTERFNTGVLVIGAGAAGLRASIELAERGLGVLCLAKRSREDAHTVLAAGGINAALATTDPLDRRVVRDTMWEHCAVVRSDPGLREALAGLDQVEARARRQRQEMNTRLRPV